jgi:hypothetical protein
MKQAGVAPSSTTSDSSRPWDLIGHLSNFESLVLKLRLFVLSLQHSLTLLLLLLLLLLSRLGNLEPHGIYNMDL